jgi:hypothetical protein
VNAGEGEPDVPEEFRDLGPFSEPRPGQPLALPSDRPATLEPWQSPVRTATPAASPSSQDRAVPAPSRRVRRGEWWRRSEVVLVRAVVASVGSVVLVLVLVPVAVFWGVVAVAARLSPTDLFLAGPFAAMMCLLVVSSACSATVVPAVWAARVRTRRHEEAVVQRTGRSTRLPDSDLEVHWLLTGARFAGFFFTAVHTGDERGLHLDAARRLPPRPERWLAPVRPFRAPWPSRSFDHVRTSAPTGTWLVVGVAAVAETGLWALVGWAAGGPL